MKNLRGSVRSRWWRTQTLRIASGQVPRTGGTLNRNRQARKKLLCLRVCVFDIQCGQISTPWTTFQQFSHTCRSQRLQPIPSHCRDGSRKSDLQRIPHPSNQLSLAPWLIQSLITLRVLSGIYGPPSGIRSPNGGSGESFWTSMLTSALPATTAGPWSPPCRSCATV